MPTVGLQSDGGPAGRAAPAGWTPLFSRSRRGAGHASHAVNGFRKIAGIEAYTPTDNVSELTARVNDDGWETSSFVVLNLYVTEWFFDLFG
jgi:hypothetical protein